MAISLSFDDARTTNPTEGVSLLNEYHVDATFYVLPSRVEENIEGWRHAVETGHEMANHSIHHPCSGNFGWARPLEDYTMDRMRDELMTANKEIKRLLGVDMVSYAYPCGQITIGRGENSQSFIPLISELFLTGREWLSEAPVDPWYCDMAALTGMKMDNKDFEEILPIIEAASKKGQWLILAGHETEEASKNHSTKLSFLRKLCEYAKDPKNGIWIAPVGTIGKYVVEKRAEHLDKINIPQITRKESDNFILKAINGKGVGPNIKYMPEWEAFGWFMEDDRVEWDMEVETSGVYNVYMEWSVDDKEAGKGYVIEVGNKRQVGKVEKSGSWETFKKKLVGQIHLKSGYNRVVFKPESKFGEGALLDLKTLTFQLDTADQ
ncbi:hypothetical protein GCM10025777_55520 [Membranihabitans marinus]